MKNAINKIKNTKGFVSIESVMVIGVVVVIAGLILFFFNNRATEVQTGAKGQIDQGITNAQTGTGSGITVAK